jgi:NAD(P)H-dependent FMN reductase
MKVKVVLGSTRPGRMTERMAKWVVNEAKNIPATEVELVDLADYDMPLMNEAKSPRYNPDRQLVGAVKSWVEKMAEGEAYIFVTPEYNHSVPGVLKNAIDYLTWELMRKPATVASHGTVGGARATMHLKEILSESRAAVIPTQVALAQMSDKIDEQGELADDIKKLEYGPQTALKGMLEELKWYSDALSAARAKDAS